MLGTHWKSRKAELPIPRRIPRVIPSTAYGGCCDGGAAGWPVAGGNLIWANIEEVSAIAPLKLAPRRRKSHRVMRTIPRHGDRGFALPECMGTHNSQRYFYNNTHAPLHAIGLSSPAKGRPNWLKM